jgi:hypothetical protein
MKNYIKDMEINQKINDDKLKYMKFEITKLKKFNSISETESKNAKYKISVLEENKIKLEETIKALNKKTREPNKSDQLHINQQVNTLVTTNINKIKKEKIIYKNENKLLKDELLN